MPNLRIITRDGRIYSHGIKNDKISIGRDKRNDIVFAETNISRFHAQIVNTNKGLALIDLDSFNGTMVNEKQIQMVLLRPNDQIRIGFNRLTYLPSSRAETSEESAVNIAIEEDAEKDEQHIIKSSPQTALDGATNLILPVNLSDTQDFPPLTIIKDETNLQVAGSVDISVLERNNKVLYILYEISRQMGAIQDLNELLKKIMDLIFTVIDADSGFLILISEDEKEKLVPVVVKYREEKAREKGKLRISRTIISKVISEGVALLTSNAMGDSRLGKAESVFIQQIRSAMCVPLRKRDKIIGAIQLDSIRVENHFTEQDLELLKTIGNQMAMIIEQANLNKQVQEEERLRSRLERYHSPQVIDFILKSDQAAKDDFLEPKYIDATILFCDIVGFTSFSEKIRPMDTILILNRYFSNMTDIVFTYDGTIDKFMGDGLLAVFGAPIKKKGDAQRAVLAALEMRNKLSSMMDKTPESHRFKIRTGINSGRVVAGNIGSPKRMDYSVIGDAVNTASRLESIASPNQILIGEKTYLRVKDKFKINKIGPKRVKGKRAEIIVYEVLASVSDL